MTTDPIGYIRVNITTYHPHDPANPDGRGDQGTVAPLIFPIHAIKGRNAFQLPQGMLQDVRHLLSGVVKHCREYKPDTTSAQESGLTIQTAPVTQETLNAVVEQNIEASQSVLEELPQGICARCGWREIECGCEEGFLADDAA